MIKLEGYKTIKKIASGGMGDVFLAEHLKLKKQVAIKSLHKNLVNNNDFRKRFENEAQTHAKLDHPNIVKLLDFKERKDGLFLIMEYVNGKTLDEHVKIVSGPIPENELATLYIQVLNAIGYAHDKGLVHRDIKPDNIMIDKNGNIKILDFGIAKMNEDDSGLTKTGIQIGTATYMSPEQVDAKNVDMLSDIYSLGVTLFYLAVGKSPYSDVTNTYRIQEKIMKEPFPLASDFYPAVSKKLQEIILKATQKKKSDRYQSCNEFLSKLKKITTQKVNNKTETQDIISNNTKSSSKGLSPRLKIIWTLVLLLIISILFYFSSDLQFNDTNNSEKVIADSSLNVSLKIGDFYEGGVVFYIEKNGDYALVSDINDLGKAKFGCIGFYAWKDSPDLIGSGEKNTNYWANITPSAAYNTIKKYNTDRLPQYRVKDQDRYDAEAALLCKKSSNKGYTDWFLPSIDELKEMHNNQSLIDSISLLNGGSIFLDQYYWSSSADNLTNDCTEKINFKYKTPVLVRRSGFREQINNVRSIRVVKDFYVEVKSTKEKVSLNTTSKENSEEKKTEKEKVSVNTISIDEASEEKLAREKAEKVVQNKIAFQSISSKFFKDDYLTKEGRLFLSKLLNNFQFFDSKEVAASFYDSSKILIIDRYVILFFNYRFDVFDIWSEKFMPIFSYRDYNFRGSKVLHPTTDFKLSTSPPYVWFYSKKYNILCTDQENSNGGFRKNYLHFSNEILTKNLEKEKESYYNYMTSSLKNKTIIEEVFNEYNISDLIFHETDYDTFTTFLETLSFWSGVSKPINDLEKVKVYKWNDF